MDSYTFLDSSRCIVLKFCNYFYNLTFFIHQNSKIFFDVTEIKAQPRDPNSPWSHTAMLVRNEAHALYIKQGQLLSVVARYGCSVASC
jgi:hypothetical protein